MADYGLDKYLFENGISKREFMEQASASAAAPSGGLQDAIGPTYATDDVPTMQQIAAGGCNVPYPYIGDVPPTVPYPYQPHPHPPGGYTATTNTLTPAKKADTMNIWMIWANAGSLFNEIWLVDAWDDDTVTANRDGWEDAVREAQREHGAANIRITKTSVNFDKVRAAFEPVEI